MFGEMKLNGKVYLKESEIINLLEDIIISLECGDYAVIAESIRDIKVENAENTAINLASFQDMYRAYFKNEKYCKMDLALEMAETNLYDATKERVKLYTQGAYGVRIRSDDKSVEKYVFNTCVCVFIKRIKEICDKDSWNDIN